MSRRAERHSEPTPLRLRAMAAADLPRVVEIENLSSPSPWSRDIFEGCMRPDHLCLVGERCGCVVGFAVASAAAGESHLLNLAVHPEHRMQGIGALLLAAAVANLKRRFVDCLYLEVRVSNRIAIDLYERFGFRRIGHRRDYYARGHGREDALTMKLVFAG